MFYKKTLLFQEDKYSLWRQAGIPSEAITFLEDVAWGNEGAVYEHKNTSEHIKQLHKPSLISIWENEEIQGTAVFCNCQVRAKEEEYNCYYIRYFASSAKIRGKGIIKHLSKKVMEAVRRGEEEKTIFFACIEKGNKGSYKVVESAGYHTIGTIKTIGFSRFFPKRKSAIQRIESPQEQEEVLGLVRDSYKSHALVQFNALFLDKNYFVIRKNGQIVAGCQLHKVHWVVKSMPGISGKLIMRLVPGIPLLKKLFNAKKFEFLAFEGIYFKPRHEHYLHELFEGLLAQEKLNSAMFWMSDRCPYFAQLMEYGKLGLLHSFIKDSDVYILAAFENLSAEEISSFKHSPLYASAFDYI